LRPGILPDGRLSGSLIAAVTDQEEAASDLLFQDIDIPAGSTVTCSVVVYYENRGNEFVNGPDLSYMNAPNQQARIDIMDPDAPPFNIGPGVLLNLFQTNPGDPPSLGYTTLDFDLSAFKGTTVRFRAAGVVTLSVLNFAIDDLKCTEITAASIPTLSEWGLIAMAGILGFVEFMVMRRRKATA